MRSRTFVGQTRPVTPPSHPRPSTAVARARLEPTSRLVDTTTAWLREQLEPLHRPMHDDLIRLDRLYPSSYVGPVAGSFVLPPGTFPIAAGTPIEIGSPGDLLPDHRGMVHGRVVAAADGSTEGCTVHYGKVADGFTSLGSVAPDEAGFFGIDLSGVDASVRGAWAFQLRASDGADVGGRWPSPPVFTTLSVELRSITDDEYTIATLPAPTTGQVAFDASAPGTKRLALVGAEGTLLGATSAATGAIRSFAVAPGHPDRATRLPEQTFAYDQAVALMAAVSARRSSLAHELARGLLRLQTTDGQHVGAFRLSARQGSPDHGELRYRTGAHALATHAVLAHMRAFPQRASALAPAAHSALAWLLARVASSGDRQGLVLGGFDPVSPDDQTPGHDGSRALTWASTEHNIDAYFCFRLAAEVVDGSWAAHAEALATAMLQRLWSPGHARLLQGLQESGPDTADPLDVHAWGAVFLADVGEHAKAAETLGEAQLAPFRHTCTMPDGREVAGYATAYASPGYPGMTPHVWWEGTFSVAYALRTIGHDERAEETIALAAPGQLPDGSFRSVSRADPTYGLVDHAAVASTAWATLAALGSGIFDVGNPR